MKQYTVKNNNTNEEKIINGLPEVADLLGITPSIIYYQFKKTQTNKITIGEWVISSSDCKLPNAEPKRKIKHFRTIEGDARESLTPKDYKKFIELLEKKKRIFEEKIKSVQTLKTNSDIIKQTLWKNHCKRTCTLSDDGKTYIPNSLLKDFPELKNMKYPKTMM